MSTTNLKMRIIGAANTLGCGKDGVQFGPKSIRDAQLINRLKKYNISIEDHGDIETICDTHVADNDKLKNIVPITEFCKKLADAVQTAYQDGFFPLVLGGDHSLGIGSVAGASRVFGADDLCVIWIDAHTDINTQDTSPTGNIHGMTLASLLGYGCEQLTSICGKDPKVKAENIIYIASRDVDPGEQQIIRSNGIAMFSAKDIEQYGVNEIAYKIKSHINKLKTQNIYLSIDIDVLDPHIAPGTGVPVPNGINPEMLYEFTDTIINTGKVKGIELVEVNPLLDISTNPTAKLAVDIIDHIVRCIVSYHDKR